MSNATAGGEDKEISENREEIRKNVAFSIVLRVKIGKNREEIREMRKWLGGG